MSYDLIGEYDEVIGDDDDLDLDIGDEFDDVFEGDDPDVDALLAGDDDDAIIGAALKAKGMSAAARKFMGSRPELRAIQAVTQRAIRKAKRRKAVAGLAMRRNHPIGVRTRPFRRAGQMPLGFQSLALAAGASVNITLTPPVVYKPKRLLIPSDIAGSLRLTQLLIGQISCLTSGNPIPCESFEERSVNGGWKLPTLQIGQQMVMTFQNKSGAAVDVEGCWQGSYVD